MMDTKEECKAAENWARAHKDQILADYEAGNTKARSVIRLHQMLMRHSDAPTWAIFIGAVDSYRKELERRDSK